MKTEESYGCFKLAAWVSGFQGLVALLVAGGKIDRLVAWDAAWYRDIAIKGYHFEHPLVRGAGEGSNLALFPAFPVWTRIFSGVLGLPADLAVTLAGWSAGFLMWAMFFFLLRSMKLGLMAALGVALAFLIQPGSFYFSVGYSEALFILGILGFVFWTDRWADEPRPWNGIGAIAFGGLMTAGRLVGVPLVVYPLLKWIFQTKKGNLYQAALISLMSVWGFASFLVYSQIKFGNWHAYWDANREGWGVAMGAADLFRPSYYFENFLTGNLPEMTGRILTLAILIGLLRFCVTAWRERGEFLPLGLLALALLMETIIGSHGMHSMTRYLLPVDAVAFPLLLSGFEKPSLFAGAPKISSRQLFAAAALGTLFTIQIVFFIRYIQGQWVS